MNSNQKLSLLSDLIAFSVVDGKLADQEYDFLLVLAQHMNIEKADFLKLFELKQPLVPIQDIHQRILQFYKLCLLMFVDGLVHEKEIISIREKGIQMGLNPNGIEKVIELMSNTPNRILSSQVVFDAFNEQWN